MEHFNGSILNNNTNGWLKDPKEHVLVTGGAGYIGSALVPMLLQYGYEVTIYDNFTWGALHIIDIVDHPNLHVVYGDILDVDHLAKILPTVDSVIHLAAIAGFPACDRDPQKATDINALGTKNICDLLKPHQKIVYSSTGSCYGKIEGVCTEETPIAPLSHYGITKAEGEAHVKKFGGVIVRLATLFGLAPKLRIDLLLNDLTFTALKTKSLDIFEGHFRRTLLHVKDAARAFILTLEKYKVMKGQVYNIGDERMNITKIDTARMIQSKVPGCTITSSSAGSDPDKRDYAVSYEKIQKLGFTSTISIEKGLDDMITVFPKLQRSEVELCANGRNSFPSVY